MRCLLALVLVLALGCSASGRAIFRRLPTIALIAALDGRQAPGAGSHGAPLQAASLRGPFKSREAACAAMEAWARDTLRWKRPSCTTEPVSLGPRAPFATIELLEIRQPEPALRCVDTGAFFLALADWSGWYVTADPLDAPSSGAGHTFLPVISPLSAEISRRPAGAQALVRVRDAITAVRIEDPKSGPRAEKIWDLALVCGRDRAGVLRCTPPVQMDPRAEAELSPRGALVVTPPGGEALSHPIVF